MFSVKSACEKDKNIQLVIMEAERLSRKYNKEFLDCKDLMSILSIGRDNVRTLLRSKGFPVITVGNRKVVSVLSFVRWEMDKTT